MLNQYELNRKSSDRNDASFSSPDANSQKYSRSQKIAAISLAFFALFIMIFWLIQFKQNIMGSYSNNSAQISQSGVTGSVSQDADQDAKLRSQDTDSDGLNDYDELYVYKTSPYLEDSDSDSFSDKEEINSGNDPNCPVGQECQASTIDDSGTDTANTSGNSGADLDSLNNILSQISQDSGDGSATGELDIANLTDEELADQFSPANLRALLIENGVDKAVLDKISDEQLLQSFAEVMNEQN